MSNSSSNPQSRPPPSPAPSPPRRPPLHRRFRPPWTLAPLVIALAYAGIRGVVGHNPSLEAMVPSDAILVWRWKSLSAYDAQRGDATEVGVTVAAPSAVLGSELNVPGLPGVDRSRPILEALLSPEGRREPRLIVLPVADAKALNAKFRDPNLVERHARHLEIHGDWAASCSDRTVVRDAGTHSSPLPPSEGEDWCVTANWPAFVDFALQPEQAPHEPFASVLAALGFAPDSAEESHTSEGVRLLTIKAGRVPMVRDAWSRVTLRSFAGRVVVELDPAPDAKELRAVIAAAKPDPGDDREVSMPLQREASLHVRGAQGRRLLVYALGYGGLNWPAASAKDEFAALRLSAPGGLAAWAEIADGPIPAWNVSLAAPKAAFPDLAALCKTEPSDAGPAAYSVGAATLTTLYGGEAERTTFLPIPTATDADLLVTVVGRKADALRTKVAATITTHARSSSKDTPDRIEIATFTVSKIPLQRLLGSAALGPTGLFATLADHAIRGRLLVVGGARLRIEIEADGG